MISKTQAVDMAIISALTRLIRATARQVESDFEVVKACRVAKIKCRHRLAVMEKEGKRIRSDRAPQGAVYWVYDFQKKI